MLVPGLALVTYWNRSVSWMKLRILTHIYICLKTTIIIFTKTFEWRASQNRPVHFVNGIKSYCKLMIYSFDEMMRYYLYIYIERERERERTRYNFFISYPNIYFQISLHESKKLFFSFFDSSLWFISWIIYTLFIMFVHIIYLTFHEIN